MIVQIGPQRLNVSENAESKLLNLLYTHGQELYDKMPGAVQVMASGFARKKIYDMEREAFEKGASKEQAKTLRPAQGQDASIRMMEIMLSGFKELLKYVEIKCECDEHGTLTDFTYELKDKGETGG